MQQGDQVTGTGLRTLVVQGSGHVRSVVEWILDQDPRFHLVGSVDVGDDALQWPGPLDVALIDLAVPGLDALTVVRALRARHQDVTVVVLADVDVPYLRAAAAEAGAACYVSRSAAEPDLNEMIVRVRTSQVRS